MLYGRYCCIALLLTKLAQQSSYRPAIVIDVHVERTLPVTAPLALRTQQPVVLTRRILSQHYVAFEQQVADWSRDVCISIH